MTDAFLIEAGDVSAGVLVREDRHWRFYAAAPAFRDLDALSFRRPRDATRAAERLAAERLAAQRPGTELQQTAGGRRRDG